MKQKYTILYFIDYGQSFGGAVNALLQQAKLMQNAGHRIYLFYSDYLGIRMERQYKQICLELGIEPEKINYQMSNQTEDINIVYLVEYYEELKRKIVSYDPDILHSVQINPGVELVSRELGIPHIMNIYPLIPEFFVPNYMNIFPYYHICDSWYYAKKWQQYLGTDSICIRTVAGKTCKKTRLWCERELNYICAGSIYKEKNQLTVIKAFHKAIQSGIQGRLMLYGYAEGDYADECIQYIEENMLQDRIFIKGFCSDMQKEYAVSDVLICGSTRESYPNVISEAMANGLIIISTPAGGIPEVIKDGINGYLSTDYSADALYSKIKDFQRDLSEGRLETILVNAEKSYQENHNPQKVLHQLMQYYQYVLEDYNKRNTEADCSLIGIEDIRNTFKTKIQKFMEKKKDFSDADKVALKIWYLHHVEKEIKTAVRKNSRFYIWGTGKCGIVVKDILDTFVPEVNISGYLDSYKKGPFLGYNVYTPGKIMAEENTVVFIAAINGQDEMIQQLKENNKIFNRDYFILAPRRW